MLSLVMVLRSQNLVLTMSVILVMISLWGATADEAKDREECTNQLVGLSTCLPYVEGNAKAPTPDCCSGLKQVLKNDKKCLCVIIRDRNDPQLGLNINVTLALGLPSVCHAPANVSQCPALLHLDPSSPEAQVFYQFGNGKGYGDGAGAPAPAPTLAPSSNTTGGVGGNPTSSTLGSMGANVQGTSDGCYIGKRWLGLEIFSAGFFLLYFLYLII